MTDKEKNKQTGRRFRECIDAWGTTGKLLVQYEYRTGKTISSDSVRKYCRGERTLKEPLARVFAQILNIEPGYLMGDDDFSNASYNDYVLWLKKMGRLQELSPDMRRKQQILDLIGFNLYTDMYASSVINGIHYDYLNIISDGSESCTVPQHDLDDLDNKVTEYIRNLVQGIIIKNTPMAFDTVENFENKLHEIRNRSKNKK